MSFKNSKMQFHANKDLKQISENKVLNLDQDNYHSLKIIFLCHL